MLNYETILSSYDDKLTLMQWLKKVEDALNNASAVTFNVNKRGDATLTFSIVFEDGSEIESDPLTLQQGESVESAYIQNGNLHLVLTNGDDLDAGNLFNGDVNVTGNITATGTISAPAIEATGTGIKTDVIQQETSSGIDVYAALVHLNNGLEAQGEIESLNGIRTPVITADEAEIAAQKPIVEVMTGYSYTQPVDARASVVYAGVCKNGNKITFVVAGNIGDSDNEIPSGTSFHLGTFKLPLAIGQIIFAMSVSYCDIKDGIIANSENSRVQVMFGATKIGGSDEYLRPFVYFPSAVAASNPRAFRYEVTFLLSENMAA